MNQPSQIGHVVQVPANLALAGIETARANFHPAGETLTIQFSKASEIDATGAAGAETPFARLALRIQGRAAQIMARIEWGLGSSSQAAFVDVKQGTQVRVVASYLKVQLWSVAISEAYSVSTSVGQTTGGSTEAPTLTRLGNPDPAANLAPGGSLSFAVPPFAASFLPLWDNATGGVATVLGAQFLSGATEIVREQYAQPLPTRGIALPDSISILNLTNNNAFAIKQPSVVFFLAL